MAGISETFDFELTDKQEQFVRHPARYLLNSGGAGSGKSYALIFRTLRLLVEHPGIKILITDSNWPSLRDTTYADFQVVIPEILVKKHNRVSHQFDFINGSTVIFRAFDNPNKLKRYTFGAIAVEELTDIGEDFFKMARTRLRQPGFPGLFYAATNPSTFQNWVYRYFIETPIEGSAVIFSSTHDNDFLDESYINDMDSIKDIDEKYYERMVKGKWGTLEGLIYNLPAQYRKLPDNAPIPDLHMCAVDFGFEHETAICTIAVVGDDFYVTENVYEKYLTSDDIVGIVEDLNAKTPFYGIFADSARPEIIKDLSDAGLPARPAQKGAGSVFAGIMKIKSLIKQGRLYVSEDSENVLKEFDSYIWAKPTISRKFEEPLKTSDHALDAIRYAIYTYLREDAGDTSLDNILKLQKML